MTKPDPSAANPRPAVPALVPARPSLRSSELMKGAKSVEISHNGLIYRLQITRLGKLILTK